MELHEVHYRWIANRVARKLAALALILAALVAVPVYGQPDPVFTTRGRVVEIASHETAGVTATATAGGLPHVRMDGNQEHRLAVRAGSQVLVFAFDGEVPDTGLSATVHTLTGPETVYLGDRVRVRFRVDCVAAGACSVALMELDPR